MKKLLTLLMCMVASSAFAETCTYLMKDYYGNEVQRFTRYSYSYYAACDEARYDCLDDKAEREATRGSYGLVCNELLNSPNYPTPYPPPSYPTPYPPPSYPTPYPPPSYPTPYPPPSYPYPKPLPPRDPHWPSEPREPRYPRDPREPMPPRDPHWPSNPREPRR